MSNKRFTEEFKQEAVKLINERQYSVAEVSSRLGVSTHSLYSWLKAYGPNSEAYQAKTVDHTEILRLRKELKRVTEERDILKKPPRTLQKCRSKVRIHSRTSSAVFDIPYVSRDEC